MNDLTDTNLYNTSSNHKKRCNSDRSDSTDTLLKVAREEPVTDNDFMGHIKGIMVELLIDYRFDYINNTAFDF